MLVEVSHVVEHRMIPDKSLPAPLVCDFLSREQSRSHYALGSEFQIGKIERVANTGTYPAQRIDRMKALDKQYPMVIPDFSPKRLKWRLRAELDDYFKANPRCNRKICRSGGCGFESRRPRLIRKDLRQT